MVVAAIRSTGQTRCGLSRSSNQAFGPSAIGDHRLVRRELSSGPEGKLFVSKQTRGHAGSSATAIRWVAVVRWSGLTAGPKGQRSSITTSGLAPGLLAIRVHPLTDLSRSPIITGVGMVPPGKRNPLGNGGAGGGSV